MTLKQEIGDIILTYKSGLSDAFQLGYKSCDLRDAAEEVALKTALQAIIEAVGKRVPKEKEVNVPTLWEPDKNETKLIVSAMNTGYNSAIADLHKKLEE